MKEIKGKIKEVNYRNYSPTSLAGELEIRVKSKNEEYAMKLPGIIPVEAGDRVRVEYENNGKLRKLIIENKNFTYINML